MNCKNCKQSLKETDRFCNDCGARVISETITYSYLVNDISERFFNFENNLIVRTLRDMFLSPKLVIDGYISGVRKKHLNVASYLAIAITISGLQMFLMNKLFVENIDMSWMVDENNPMTKNNGTSIFNGISEYQSLLYVLLIPVYALTAKLIFLNKKKYTYLHHIIITCYTQAHMSLVLFIPTVLLLSLGVNFFKITYFIAFPLMILFSAYVYKKVFSLSLKQILLKTLLFLIVGFIIYMTISILIFISMLAAGVIDIQDFAPKKETADSVTYAVASLVNWTS